MSAPDIYTKAHLHFTGADGSTTFTDETGKTWTANGNAQIDTAQYKFSPSSGLFDGAGDWINTPAHADFDLGTQLFTVEMFYKKAATGTTQWICGQNGATYSTDLSFAIQSIASSFQVHWNMGSGGIYSRTVNLGIDDTSWHFLQFLRNSSGEFRLHVDGSGLLLETIPLVNPVSSSSSPLSIGRTGAVTTENFNGLIDEFRYSVGILRSTSVPTYPFGNNFIPRITMIGE